MSKEMHLYNCTACKVQFGIEAEEEDQSGVGCPFCKKEESVTYAGYALLTILPSTVEKGEEQDAT